MFKPQNSSLPTNSQASVSLSALEDSPVKDMGNNGNNNRNGNGNDNSHTHSHSYASLNGNNIGFGKGNVKGGRGDARVVQVVMMMVHQIIIHHIKVALHMVEITTITIIDIIIAKQILTILETIVTTIIVKIDSQSKFSINY